MSFDVNIGRAEPIIKAASGMNNDGGSGGNTGYMGGGRRQKKENRGSLFESNSERIDSFEMTNGFKNSENIKNNNNSWLNKLFGKS